MALRLPLSPVVGVMGPLGGEQARGIFGVGMMPVRLTVAAPRHCAFDQIQDRPLGRDPTEHASRVMPGDVPTDGRSASLSDGSQFVGVLLADVGVAVRKAEPPLFTVKTLGMPMSSSSRARMNATISSVTFLRPCATRSAPTRQPGRRVSRV